MSITIDRDKCIDCGCCRDVCPGSLIRLDEGRAVIPHPERCWGCASCVKECPIQAVALYLGEDIGGLGGRMTARSDGSLLHWTLTKPDGYTTTLTVDSRNSNQY
ncbi:ferredoxin [Clostridia bacterium]|nr:ferredoxin [Clostridia bacterium]